MKHQGKSFFKKLMGLLLVCTIIFSNHNIMRVQATETQKKRDISKEIEEKETYKVTSQNKPQKASLSKVKLNDKKAVLTWKKQAGVSGYEVYMSKAEHGTYKKIKTITNASTTKYITGVLANDTVYYFKIRAYKSTKGKKTYGAYSSFRSVVRGNVKVNPAKLYSVTIKDKKAVLTWGKQEEVSGYTVYMAKNKNGTYKAIKEIKNCATTKYTTGVLKEGQTYYFKIRPYKNVSGKKVYGNYSKVEMVKRPKRVDAKAVFIEFKNTTGGDFVKSYSHATASFKLDNTSTDVEVIILDSIGKEVYKKVYSKCKENKLYSFKWDGKDAKGNYVATDIYSLCVLAGNEKTYSEVLKFYATNDFAGGDGSAINPYQVANITQLRNVGKYNGRVFKQIADINGDNANFAPLFTEDSPFTGVYDGNNYSISNLYFRSEGSVGLFTAVSGTIQNVRMEKINMICTYGESIGAITGINSGNIIKCSVNDSYINLSGNSGSDYGKLGGIVGYNYSLGPNVALIQSCTVSNIKVECTWEGYGHVGGICGENGNNIWNCTSENVKLYGIHRAGGIVGYTSGQIYWCSTIGDCEIAFKRYRDSAVYDNDGYAIAGGVHYADVQECYTDTTYELYRK